jgi:hypothetical protein
MEVVRTSETSVDNHFTRQYIPEDNSEQDKKLYSKNEDTFIPELVKNKSDVLIFSFDFWQKHLSTCLFTNTNHQNVVLRSQWK